MTHEQVLSVVMPVYNEKEFVGRRVPWVHIDIAGPAYTREGRDYSPPGGTGVPLRTLFSFLRTL